MLEDVIVTDDLKKNAPKDTSKVELSLDLSKDQYCNIRHQLHDKEKNEGISHFRTPDE